MQANQNVKLKCPGNLTKPTVKRPIEGSKISIFKPKTLSQSKLVPKFAFKARLKAVPKPALKPCLKPALKPGLKPCLKPALKPYLKPALKPCLKPAPKPALKPCLKTVPKPAPKPCLKAAPKPALKPCLKVAPKPPPKLAPKPPPKFTFKPPPKVAPKAPPKGWAYPEKKTMVMVNQKFRELLKLMKLPPTFNIDVAAFMNQLITKNTDEGTIVNLELKNKELLEKINHLEGKMQVLEEELSKALSPVVQSAIPRPAKVPACGALTPLPKSAVRVTSPRPPPATMPRRSMVPPPPPLPMSGIPPPPPFMSGIPVPPPQMGMSYQKLPPGLKPKRKWAVDVPLKQANWTVIRPTLMTEKSFWLEANEDEIASEEVLQELKARFASRAPACQNPAGTTIFRKAPAYKVIDAKTAQNLMIGLRKILKTVSPCDLKLMFLQCDPIVFDESLLKQLKENLPQPDQLKKLQVLRAKGETLSDIENLLATIGDIKRFNQRITSFMFRIELPEMVQYVKQNIAIGTAALKELIHNDKFRNILALILALGNYLNASLRKEPAYGYELNYLTKLRATKDADNKRTYVHYIAETVEKRLPVALDFPEDLKHLDRATRINVDDIKKTIENMKSSLKNLETEVDNHQTCQMTEDRFGEVMGCFAQQSRAVIGELGKGLRDMESLYRALAVEMTIDTKKYTMEETFADIKVFKDEFIMAHRENLKMRADKEKALQREQQRQMRCQPQG